MLEIVVMTPKQNAGAMWEAEADAEWERINEDPYHDQMVGAACKLDLAKDHLDKALDFMLDALSEVENTPMESTVQDLLEKVEDIKCAVDMQKSKYEGGEIE